MLRVLVLSSRFPDGLRPNLGIFVERQTLELAAQPGVEVQVVAPIGRSLLRFWGYGGGHGLDSLPPGETWKGIAVRRPRFAQWPYLARLRPGALARTLVPLGADIRRDFPFDVVSAEFSWPDGPAAVALARAFAVPVVIKARGMEFERRVASFASRSQILAAARAAQGLLAVSAELKAKMAAVGLPSAKIAVHYPGVDTELFRPGDAAETKRRLGVGGPLLLTVGNLIPEKRQRLAVAALATLLVVGTGPEGAALREQARRLGLSDRVRMLGSVPHPLLPSLYAAADVTFHGSAVEGFGNVRLESLACGTPVVTTDVGEAARVIDRAGHGRIVPPEAKAMAAAARELLANPPPRALVRSAVDSFTWARNAAELERHLRAAVEAGPTNP
jgi:glycosyltransferase involved in cell wall biosynthesis